MILTKYEDLAIPLEDIWDKLNYKSISLKNKLNLLISNKKLIHSFDDDIDNIMLYALSYYDNINSFVLFGKNKSDAYNYYLNNFKDDYILYGLKHLELNSSIIPKIMYQLLFSRMIIKTKNDLYNYIEDQYKYLSEYKETLINVSILIVCKRDLKKKYPIYDKIDTDFCIYIPNTKEEIWHCASVFFCNSTLKFLNYQNFDFFLTKDMEKSKKMFLRYRKWLNLNIDCKHQSQFMLFSSVVLYLLGHRAMNDLDLYVHTIPVEIQDKLVEFKSNEIFNFIDFKVKNTDNWPNYWNSWLDEWATNCGAKYFEEILGNPKYHFYFLGVKIISLDCDVQRRLHRNRPRAVADLIALRKRYSYNVRIPSVPNSYTKYTEISNLSEIEINKLLKEGGILNEKNKEIALVIPTNVSKFINTVIFALSTRYKMTFSVDEIKKELNMIERERCKIVSHKIETPLENNEIGSKKIKIIIKKNVKN